MDCTEFQTILAGERESDLSPAESSAFEGHLEACEACRGSLARAETDLGTLGALAQAPVLADAAWVAVDQAVRAQALTKPGREDPFTDLLPREVAAPVAPAAPVLRPALLPANPVAALSQHPSRQHQTLQHPARRASRKSGLGLVAAAAVATLIMTVFFLNGKAPEKPHLAIGKVKALEAGDVDVVEFEAGPAYQASMVQTDKGYAFRFYLK